jgi:hypothetical protein
MGEGFSCGNELADEFAAGICPNVTTQHTATLTAHWQVNRTNFAEGLVLSSNGFLYRPGIPFYTGTSLKSIKHNY